MAANGIPSPLPASGENWSGCDLQGLSIYEANLSGMNFTGADLQGAALPSVTGTGVDFSGANLSGVDMHYGNMSSVNFAGANLQNVLGGYVQLTDGSMTGADISNANFGTATFTHVRTGGLITASGAPTLPAGLALDHGYLVGPGASFFEANFSATEANVPDLASKDLSNADFGGADLAGLNLSNDNLTGATFLTADLTSANLDSDTLTNADFSQAQLVDATMDGANLTGVKWLTAECPDGTYAALHNQTCVNNIDDRAPVAHPTVSGTSVNGWYRQATTTWNWTESSGTIDAAKCTASTTNTVQGKAVALSAMCYNTVGARGIASVSVNIENSGPAVAVTGLTSRRVYAAGHVPAPGCRTTDALSGVAKAAALSVTSAGWQHGVGAFTATCAGALNKAAIAQAAAVQVKYTVVYGVSGFVAPKNKASVARSARKVPVSFKLGGLTAALAAKFAAAGRVRIVLTGPGIIPVTVTAAWQPKSGTFTASLPIPAKVKTGKAYQITVRENTGPGWLTAPATGKAVNPQTIQFHA